ncbi:hypothetical protein CDAR_281911 [Caerostris darwini]|uniref:Uncharacterized protein n=1 Tax=Caerostris darwini TaxID=1538125 RepID=A0AAV4WT15_9ARAC|nr:hypothetical protein CDAR_281911 [Caerostris darwini]
MHAQLRQTRGVVNVTDMGRKTRDVVPHHSGVNDLLFLPFGVSGGGELKRQIVWLPKKCLEFAFSILRCLEDICLQWNLPPLFIIIMLLLWRGS